MELLNGSFPNQTGFVYNCNGLYPSKAAQITTYGVVMVLAMIGNLLIVSVFYRKKSLKTPVHYFIVNMAIADLTIPVIVLPWGIAQEYYGSFWLLDGVVGLILCKLVWIAWGVSVAVSILTMVAIAIDRFHAVLFAMNPALISRKTCRLIIALIWIASLLFRAHYFYAIRLVRHHGGLICLFQWDPPSYTEEALKISWISFLGISIFAGLVLTVLYSSTIVFLYRQKNNVHMASEIIKRRAKENRNVTCMLVTVVVIFYAVWIPHQAESLIHFLRPNRQVPCFFYWLSSYVLAVLYPVLNPLVYYVFNEKYRQGFKEVLCCACPGNMCFRRDNSASHSKQRNSNDEHMALQETLVSQDYIRTNDDEDVDDS